MKGKTDDHEDEEWERPGTRDVVGCDRMGSITTRLKAAVTLAAMRELDRRHAANVADSGEAAAGAAPRSTLDTRIHTLSRCERDPYPKADEERAENTTTTRHAANSRLTRPAPMVSRARAAELARWLELQRPR